MQFNRHLQFWAQNWMQNWAKFWAKFSTTGHYKFRHVLKLHTWIGPGSGPHSGTKKMSIELCPRVPTIKPRNSYFQLSTPIILPRVRFYVVVVVFRLCLTWSGWSEFGLDTRKSDAGDIFRDRPNDRDHLNHSRNARFLPKARIKSRRHEGEPLTRQGI